MVLLLILIKTRLKRASDVLSAEVLRQPVQRARRLDPALDRAGEVVDRLVLVAQTDVVGHTPWELLTAQQIGWYETISLNSLLERRVGTHACALAPKM